MKANHITQAMLAFLMALFTVFPIFGIEAAGKKNIMADATNMGPASGNVFDADTGAPLVGASVACRVEGHFAEKGPTTAATNRYGHFTCRALLGRLSSNVNVGNVLLTVMFGYGGGLTTNTRRLDATRLAVRVSQPGFKTYEGVVPCEEMDPVDFAVQLAPILMAPVNSAFVSTAAPGWGMVRLEDVQVNPPIVRPGGQVTVTAHLECPPVADRRSLQAMVRSPLWGTTHRMKVQPGEDNGRLVFVWAGKVGPHTRAESQPLEVVLEKCPYEVAPEGWHNHALIQVVTTDGEDQAAQLRLQAYQDRAQDDNVAAAGHLKQLCPLPEAVETDFTDLGEVLHALHDEAGAAEAYQQALDRAPRNKQSPALASYVLALSRAGEYDTILKNYVPTIDKTKVKDQPKDIPLWLMVGVARAYMETGQLSKAQTIADGLDRWKDADQDTALADLRSQLRLAAVQAQVEKTPDDALARAAYGRVLLDMGRWEEAVQQLRQALKITPDMPAVQRDLEYGLLHLSGPAQVQEPQELDQAITAAEAQTVIIDGKARRPTKDFFAWHSLAILCYARARQYQDAGDSVNAQAMTGRCLDALAQAIPCGRQGAAFQPGLSYGGPFMVLDRQALVAVTGFAYPEAASDFILRHGLEDLQRNPDDYLALYEVGSSLVELHHADLAAQPLRRALEIRPDFVDALYAEAVGSLQLGNSAQAMKQLKQVLKLDPMHSRANLTLARIYTEQGDMADAAGCLAAHARYYGHAELPAAVD